MSGPIRVLHVDDDPNFADVTATYLEREQPRIAVETATDPKAGFARIADAEFDCVVSDHEMPTQNGIEFLESVRERYPELPFILFTGKGSEAVASEAISAGVTDYLQKTTGPEQYELLANRITNVVEARQSREMLEERTRRLETLIENLPGMVYRSRNERGWPMEVVEGEVAELTGYTAEAFESGSVVWGEDVLHPEDREPMWETVQDALDGDGTFEVTYRITTADGDVRWMWERGRGVYRDGELTAIEGFITEITERKTRERELREARMKLDAFGRAFPDVAFIKDVDGNYLEAFASPESESLLSSDPASYNDDKNVSDVFDGGMADRALATIREAIETGEIQSIEYQLAVPSGQRWFDARIAPLADEIDRRQAVVWVARDITDRLERERDLRETRDRMEFALEATDSVVFETDLETGTVRRHGPTERLYGDVPMTTAEEFYEHSIHPEDREQVRQIEQELTLDAGAMSYEFRTHPDTGEIRWINSKARVQAGGNGEPETLIGLSTEITDRKDTERHLAQYASTLTQLQRMTRRLLDTTDRDAAAEIVVDSLDRVFEFDIAGIWLADESQSRLEPAAITEEGRELIDEPPTYTPETDSLSWAAYTEQTPRIIDRMDDHESRHNPDTPIRSELIVPIGEYGVMNIGSESEEAFDEQDSHRVQAWASTVAAAFARLEQIRRLREREQELQRERKRLDEFASFVSHELRNPLNIATLRLELASREGGDDNLAAVEDALDRMDALTDDLLALARHGNAIGETEQIDIRELATGCWQEIEAGEAALDVRTDGVIDGDRSRLTSLFANLFQNSIEHGGDDVTVTVGTLADDGFYVADDGAGIGTEHREQIFNSGYSTSETGTGLGLAIVKQVVETHGWEIRLTESASGGARFEITGVTIDE